MLPRLTKSVRAKGAQKMKTPSNISELIEQLEIIKKEHGDLMVRCESISHMFRPDLTVRTYAGTKILILNG